MTGEREEVKEELQCLEKCIVGNNKNSNDSKKKIELRHASFTSASKAVLVRAKCMGTNAIVKFTGVFHPTLM